MRKTNTVILPFEEDGQKIPVELWAYATGADYKEIQNQLMRLAKIQAGGEATFDLASSKYSDIEDLTVSRLVVSVDGKTDDIVKTVGELHIANYQFLIKELNKLTSVEEVKKD